jgi:hypothetical protein
MSQGEQIDLEGVLASPKVSLIGTDVAIEHAAVLAN